MWVRATVGGRFAVQMGALRSLRHGVETLPTPRGGGGAAALGTGQQLFVGHTNWRLPKPPLPPSPPLAPPQRRAPPQMMAFISTRSTMP